MVKVLDAKGIGETVRTLRKAQGLTQVDLALANGVGVRFVVELERGKETCQIGLSLKVLRSLGVGVDLQYAVPAPVAPPGELKVDTGMRGFVS